MKNISILGSTGSIGRSALEVISQFPDKFRVVGLTAGRNASLLIEQIKRFKPLVAAVSDEGAYHELKTQTPNLNSQNPEILFGTEGICAAASMPEVDIVLSSIVGAAGLLPTVSAIKAGKTVALANKEVLVAAGELVMKMAKEYNAPLLPVDSEHSALFQCLDGRRYEDIKKLILTASGGPFVGKTKDELIEASPSDALIHPNWSMGKKITIDSATLMNKGLEVIEAHHLFGIPVEGIDVLIHPQSIVHSIVEFTDGTYMAQLSTPDMRAPIAYALSYPQRLPDIIKPLRWESLSGLTFQRPDNIRFPCLSLAYEALKAGGTMPAALNAANEAAVNAFLNGIIGFTDVPDIIMKVLDSHKPVAADDINVIIEADRQAREEALKNIKSIRSAA
ncbi:MAG: 1-deoxy-D-xylulose-5-phosphate reductoisomerase [Nitrospirae bacterium]|nr:1-deoxy-D-xylulose-5-phosphate reductoisomerase [Nitrospirota bacterium]